MKKNRSLFEKRQERGLSISEEIGFLPRENDMTILRNFYLENTHQILELHGVLMIGKTCLTIEFCKVQKINPIRIRFRVSYNPHEDIKEQFFKNVEWNDFKNIPKNTLIIIENFERALKWKKNFDKTHNIKEANNKVHSFLKEITSRGHKIIIETHFRVRYDYKLKVKRHLIEAVNPSYFKPFYLNQGISDEGFLRICENFDNHTGLLALGYLEVDWLYNQVLRRAILEPRTTTKHLWILVKRIFNSLRKREKQLIVAFSIYQIPKSKGRLKRDLRGIIKGDIEEILASLERKLLITGFDTTAFYSLSPYLSEIFFTHMEHHPLLLELKEERGFEFTKIPRYSKIKGMLDKSQFGSFFREIRNLRNMKTTENYELCFSYLELAKHNPQVETAHINNEIASTHMHNGSDLIAIDLFKQLHNEGHLPAGNEIAKYYKREGYYKKAEDLFEELYKEGHLPAGNELAIIYYDRKEDKKKALKLFKELYVKGHFPAGNELAKKLFYEEGEEEEGFKLLETLYKNQHKPAAFELASIYTKSNKYKNYNKALEVIDRGKEMYGKGNNKFERLREKVLTLHHKKTNNNESNNKYMKKFIKDLGNLFIREEMECERYFETKSNKLHIKGISVNANDKINLGLGEILIEPQHIQTTQRLIELDIKQYDICKSIRDITNDEEREKLQVERVKLLFEMEREALKNQTKTTTPNVSNNSNKSKNVKPNNTKQPQLSSDNIDLIDKLNRILNVEVSSINKDNENEIKHKVELYENHLLNLRNKEQIKSQMELYTPSHIINGIKKNKEEISKIMDELKQLM